MNSSAIIDKIQNSLMSTKQRHDKLFHNCIAAIEAADVKNVESCLSLYPNLPKEIRWANQKTQRPNLGLFQICVPLDRALCPQKISQEHVEIVKLLLNNGADPLGKATQYYEGPRVIDKLITDAFSNEKRAQLKNPLSPLRKSLNEVLCWIANRHPLEDALSVGSEWRTVSRKNPKLCQEILNNVRHSNIESLDCVDVERAPLTTEEKPFEFVRRLKI